MAHEPFEDGEVAAAMNAHFINIKMDREVAETYYTRTAGIEQQNAALIVTFPDELSRSADSHTKHSVSNKKMSARVCESRCCLPEIYTLNELLQVCEVHCKITLL